MICLDLGIIAKDKGLTPALLAERTELKASNISRILQGKYAPPLDVFILLTDAIGHFEITMVGPKTPNHSPF